MDITHFNHLVIPWGGVEPERGEFLWDTQPLRRIDRSLREGIKVISVIRTMGADWALKNSSLRCSSPPRGIGNTFNESYGYSKSYYNFISEVVKRYRGKFPIVVIENEVTAKNFW